jgi:hypothetical protein
MRLEALRQPRARRLFGPSGKVEGVGVFFYDLTDPDRCLPLADKLMLFFEAVRRA